MQHRIRAFGLRIDSEFPCQGRSWHGGEPDVLIRYGMVPENLPAGRPLGDMVWVSPEALMLKVDGLARFMIANGREVIIDPQPGADNGHLWAYLCGVLMAPLLHRRGLLALHGSAVAAAGGAVVFLGSSGSGKSTLAAAFRRQGYKMLSDDLAAVSLPKSGAPLVHPSFPQLKLWSDSARELGEPTCGLIRVLPKQGKYYLPCSEEFVKDSLPLTRIYLLDPAPGRPMGLTSLTGSQKMLAIIDQTYGLSVVKGLGLEEPHFDMCRSMAQRVELLRLNRPGGPFMLNEMVRVLVKDLAS